MAQSSAAEVFERVDAAGADAPAETKSGRTAAASGSDPWKRFTVDVWITDFNSVEFGIYRHSRNRAKSRQFSTDMDIFAEVKEDGRRTELIGYREDLWKQRSGMDKRLIIRLFSDTLNWRATMDLMIGRSLQLTLGARGIPVTRLCRQYARGQIHRLRRALGQQVANPAGKFLVFHIQGRQADILSITP